MKFSSRKEQFSVLIIGRGSTLIRWSTIPTFNCSIMVLSKDQFVFTSITIECCCTSLYCKNSFRYSIEELRNDFLPRMEGIKWHLDHVHYLPIIEYFLELIKFFDIINQNNVHIYSSPCHRKGSLAKPSNLSLNFILC